MKSLNSKFILTSAVALLAASTGWAQIPSYSQDFESLDQASPTALGDDGWLVGANVFDQGGNFIYNYFAFPAPNGGAAFSAVTNGWGGANQGAQALVVYNDYNNGDHSWANIEANFFREYITDASDVGRTMVFSFDGKLGDIQPPTTAAAFIKMLDPNNGWSVSEYQSVDTTNLTVNWETFTLSTEIRADQVGHIFQIGFMNTTTNWSPSGVGYDNINLSDAPAAGPGTSYCSGDGSGTACPCGNNGGAGEGCANGTGSGAMLVGSGSNSVSADDLVLSATNLTDGPGLYFQGNNAVNGGLGNLFGDGLRCAGNEVIRLEIQFADNLGSSATAGSIATKGNVSVGDTKRYQLWYRDADTSPCGNLFNLTNGYEVTWEL